MATVLLLYVYYNTKYRYKSFLIVGLIIIITDAEIYDKQIYKYTNNLLSGHSLKHILAGIGVYLIANLLNNQIYYNYQFSFFEFFSLLTISL